MFAALAGLQTTGVCCTRHPLSAGRGIGLTSTIDGCSTGSAPSRRSARTAQHLPENEQGYEQLFTRKFSVYGII